MAPKPPNAQGKKDSGSAPSPFDGFRHRIRSVKRLEELDTQAVVEVAQSVAQFFQERGVGSSQLRPLLQEMSTIRLQWRKENGEGEQARRRMHLFKPLVAYRIGRVRGKNKDSSWNTIYELIKEMLDRVQSLSDFEVAYAFMQSVVAYHRYYGGDD
ncbi:MAG: type III-A CRISPR-associated protein Csm2 [Firmicutes bacterium]|nr:type III-A CRISPR-associated protein Csm2 [Bacillota bacterium]